MLVKELTIQEAQSRQPWTVPYSDGVTCASLYDVPHVLASHAVLHGMKTLGKIATVYEKLDHLGGPISAEQVAEVVAMSADLLTIALRFANLHGFDLATALVRRVEEKNGVNILGDVA